jgi:hypothetical protein
LKTVNRTSAITIQMAAFANMLLFKSELLAATTKAARRERGRDKGF